MFVKNKGWRLSLGRDCNDRKMAGVVASMRSRGHIAQIRQYIASACLTSSFISLCLSDPNLPRSALWEPVIGSEDARKNRPKYTQYLQPPSVICRVENEKAYLGGMGSVANRATILYNGRRFLFWYQPWILHFPSNNLLRARLLR